ncbi:helix-turn-helix domain-containing protein [Sporosarcina sp. GW1-11]|nr:helix-turn-helix domain-containing protein [Sporosarcina sp. GW1-11]MDV6379149.1 helix-turn-helix domain-containing protein [Sporosarcina sp. GW1-11]
MLVNKAYKFRIYPNKEQEVLIDDVFIVQIDE